MKKVLLSLVVASGLLLAQDSAPQVLKLNLVVFDYASDSGFPAASAFDGKKGVTPMMEVLKKTGEVKSLHSTTTQVKWVNELYNYASVVQIPYEKCSSVNNQPLECETVYDEAGYRVNITPVIDKSSHRKAEVDITFMDLKGFNNFNIGGKEIQLPIIYRDHQKTRYNLDDGDVAVVLNSIDQTHFHVAFISAETVY